MRASNLRATSPMGIDGICPLMYITAVNASTLPLRKVARSNRMGCPSISTPKESPVELSAKLFSSGRDL